MRGSMCLASVAWFLEWTPATENAILVCREKIVAEVIGECAGCPGAALLHSAMLPVPPSAAATLMVVY